jgi:hypothetical protein
MGLPGVAKACLALGKCDGANLPFPLTPTGTPAAGMDIGGTRPFTASIHTAGTSSSPPAVMLGTQHMRWTLATASGPRW